MSRIGIIAAGGMLPTYLATSACEKGFDVFGIKVTSDVDPGFDRVVNDSVTAPLGCLGKIIDILKENRISKVIVAGKVHKYTLFKGTEIDERMRRAMTGAEDLLDHSLMRSILNEFSAEGIEVLKQTDFGRRWMPSNEVITGRAPTEDEYRDIAFGFRIAKLIAGADIGQSVIVKNRAVLAVEAIEGTDEAIRRGGLYSDGAVVVKVSRMGQDHRFDIPTVGMDTLRVMKAASAKCLAIESGNVFLLERERFVRFADENGIAVVATSGE